MRIFYLISDRGLSPIGTMNNPVIKWCKISHAGTHATQWDFQNKGMSDLTGTSCYILEVSRVTCIPAGQFCPMCPGRAKGLLPIFSIIYSENKANKYLPLEIHLTMHENTNSQLSQSVEPLPPTVQVRVGRSSDAQYRASSSRDALVMLPQPLTSKIVS